MQFFTKPAKAVSLMRIHRKIPDKRLIFYIKIRSVILFVILHFILLC